MFKFRIITCPDGTQIIDSSLKTPFNALTPVQMQEYIEIDTQIAFMERMKRKSKRKSDRKRKLERNPFYKAACMFGLV